MVYIGLFHGKSQSKMDDDWGYPHDYGNPHVNDYDYNLQVCSHRIEVLTWLLDRHPEVSSLFEWWTSRKQHKIGESMRTSSSNLRVSLQSYRISEVFITRGDIAARVNVCYCCHVICCVWLRNLGTRSSMPVRYTLEECGLFFFT